MSVDGKISQHSHKPAHFTSSHDKAHLQQQISLCDGIIFGGSTLRAYGTTMTVKNPEWLAERAKRGQPPQPINFVCSVSGKFDLNYRFFQQPVSRILLTTTEGLTNCQKYVNNSDYFEEVMVSEKGRKEGINWLEMTEKLAEKGLKKIAILGGGELMASLFAENLIDDLWVTICPVILGGKNAPSMVGGRALDLPLSLQLIEVKRIEQELFLHYSNSK